MSEVGLAWSKNTGSTISVVCGLLRFEWLRQYYVLRTRVVKLIVAVECRLWLEFVVGVGLGQTSWNEVCWLVVACRQS
jgi:hypothetical protein